jgi:lipoate---protein ligase
MAGKGHDGSGADSPTGGTVAEIGIEAGRIRRAAFSGTFTIQPIERRDVVLIGIAEALKGRPVDSEPSALAAHIRAAIPFGTELVGATPVDLARAVHIALGSPPPVERIGSLTAVEIDAITSIWREYHWRLIPERPHSAATNVALDEVLGISGRPSLRFWNWAEPAVVLGRCQSIANEVDRDAMTERGFALVRRPSGGGAMFVQPHGAITWSMVLPEEAVAGLTIRRSYETCDAWAVQSLRELGADAHHVPVNDIACSTGKIAGAAQSRRSGMVLHHTTLAYDLRMDELSGVLRIGREPIGTNAVASAAKVVAPLRSQVTLSRAAVVERLLATFQSRYGGTVEPLTAAELASAEDLAQTKYRDPVWTGAFA